MADTSWFTALTNSHAAAEEVHAAAADFPTLAAAWKSSDDATLLIWLAARLAPTLEDLSATVTSAAQLVQRRVCHIDASVLDLAPIIARVPEVAEHRLDRKAVSDLMNQALVHTLLASGVHHLLKAAFKLTHARDNQLQPPRELPDLIASAVQDASAAFSNHIAATGGPFTVLGGGSELIRARHHLIDGQVRRSV